MDRAIIVLSISILILLIQIFLYHLLSAPQLRLLTCKTYLLWLLNIRPIVVGYPPLLNLLLSQTTDFLY